MSDEEVKVNEETGEVDATETVETGVDNGTMAESDVEAGELAV